MIQAIFFDIDGTLVSFRTHRIPEDTRDALRRAADKGIKLFIATGRHPREAQRVLNGVPFDGIIALNGQYCFAGNTFVRKQALHPGDLQALVRRLAHNPYPCEFVEESRMYLNCIDEAVRQSHEAVDLALPPVEDISRVPEREIFQLVAFFEQKDEAREMALLPHCEATRWSPLFADIIPKGGSKRAGVQAMLAHFGLEPGACMAFGDGENDIPMLQCVALGIAMGNASQAVKEAARDVTDGVDNSGIRNALLRHGVL